jgi:hypothetical protein
MACGLDDRHRHFHLVLPQRMSEISELTVAFYEY